MNLTIKDLFNGKLFEVYWRDSNCPEDFDWEYQGSFSTRILANNWISEQLPGGFYKVIEVYID